jgi:hypothetical protein
MTLRVFLGTLMLATLLAGCPDDKKPPAAGGTGTATAGSASAGAKPAPADTGGSSGGGW